MITFDRVIIAIEYLTSNKSNKVQSLKSFVYLLKALTGLANYFRSEMDLDTLHMVEGKFPSFDPMTSIKEYL